MTAPDLSPEQLAADLGGRPVQAYPALLSTEPTAMSWARTGAPAGAVVVADYQASPRGRGGWPWQVQPGRGLGCSLVLRPDLPLEREGWVYVAAAVAVADALDRPEAVFHWPDTVRTGDGAVLARLGAFAELGPQRLEWVVLTLLVEEVAPPRGPLLARLADAVEARLAMPADAVLARYTGHCCTLGQQARARMVPLGPGGPVIEGRAVDVLSDGALVLQTAAGNRVAVRVPHLGLLEVDHEAAD